MPNVTTWIDKHEYKILERQCQMLKESAYEYSQKALRERMRKHESLVTRASRWLIEDH